MQFKILSQTSDYIGEVASWLWKESVTQWSAGGILNVSSQICCQDESRGNFILVLDLGRQANLTSRCGRVPMCVTVPMSQTVCARSFFTA